MKKILSLSLALCLAAVSLAGCARGNGPQETAADSEGKPDRTRTALSAPTESGPYSVLEFGYSDSVSGTLHTMEYTYWNRDRFTDTGAAKTKRMSVGGMVCTGSYVDSDYETYNTFATARYLDQNQKLFEVDDRGLLTSYFWGSSGLQTTGGTCPQEECVEIAKAFLRPYAELSSYQVDVLFHEADGLYEIEFTKYIGSCKTTDRATVTVAVSGELYSYSSTMLGRISTETVNDFDMAKTESSVSGKLYAIYGGVLERYDSVEYEILDTKLTLLEDGSAALIYTVDVSCINAVEGCEVVTSERVQLQKQSQEA